MIINKYTYNFTYVFFYVTISRRMRWAGHIARVGDRKSACMVSVVRPDGKRSLPRPISRWEVKVKVLPITGHEVQEGSR
jgi:hypothetical protein